MLVRREQRYPLRTTVPFYLDPGDPGMAFVYVQNPAGGLFPGDDVAVRVRVGPGARVHLTSPAATKVYGVEGETRQRIELELAPRAYAEVVAEPLIPQAGARLRQDVVVAMADDATFFLSEAIAPGRVAHGESFAYDRLELRTSVLTAAGGERCVDALVLEPGRARPGRDGVLGRHTHLGSALAVAPSLDVASLATELETAAEGWTAGVAVLPFDCGALVRGLASSTDELRRLLLAAWGVVRARTLGVAPPRPRK